MKKNTDSFGDDILRRISILPIVVLIFAAVVLIFYFFNSWSKNPLVLPENLGPFGDYVGGLINPAVGLVTVLLIYDTIRIQQRELQASLREMQHANFAAARMSFEQSLFAWLENYHEQIREIEIAGGKRGRVALNFLYAASLSPASTLKCMTSYAESEHSDYDANQVFLKTPPPFRKPQFENSMSYAIRTYDQIYRNNREYIGTAFRTLYRLFRWIDESEQLTPKEKWHYCALIRSQLSWSETLFLFFNGFIREGQKMAYYVNRYALLDNLETSDELINWARYEVSLNSNGETYKIPGYVARWPYTTEAFESTAAKLALGIS